MNAHIIVQRGKAAQKQSPVKTLPTPQMDRNGAAATAPALACETTALPTATTSRAPTRSVPAQRGASLSSANTASLKTGKMRKVVAASKKPTSLTAPESVKSSRPSRNAMQRYSLRLRTGAAAPTTTTAAAIAATEAQDEKAPVQTAYLKKCAALKRAAAQREERLAQAETAARKATARLPVEAQDKEVPAHATLLKRKAAQVRPVARAELPAQKKAKARTQTMARSPQLAASAEVRESLREDREAALETEDVQVARERDEEVAALRAKIGQLENALQSLTDEHVVAAAEAEAAAEAAALENFLRISELREQIAQLQAFVGFPSRG